MELAVKYQISTHCGTPMHWSCSFSFLVLFGLSFYFIICNISVFCKISEFGKRKGKKIKKEMQKNTHKSINHMPSICDFCAFVFNILRFRKIYVHGVAVYIYHDQCNFCCCWLQCDILLVHF